MPQRACQRPATIAIKRKASFQQINSLRQNYSRGSRAAGPFASTPNKSGLRQCCDRGRTLFYRPSVNVELAIEPATAGSLRGTRRSLRKAETTPPSIPPQRRHHLPNHAGVSCELTFHLAHSELLFRQESSHFRTMPLAILRAAASFVAPLFCGRSLFPPTLGGDNTRGSLGLTFTQ